MNKPVVISYRCTSDIDVIANKTFRIVVEPGSSVGETLSDIIISEIQRGATKEDLYNNYGLSKIPTPFREYYEDEKDGYFTVYGNLVGIKGFSIIEAQPCSSNDVCGNLVLVPSFTDKGDAFVKHGNMVNKYCISHIVCKCDDPANYEGAAIKPSFPYEIDAEFVTDDDLITVFLTKDRV